MPRRFDISGMLPAFGRLWLHDHTCRSLVMVDLATAGATVGAILPEEPLPDAGWHRWVPAAPAGLLATRSALWVPCRGAALRRVDAGSLATEAVASDPDIGWFAADSTAVYGLSDQPGRTLTRIADDGSEPVRRDWQGYVNVGVATERHLWLVDRTTERLVRLDAGSLATQWSHDFAGGEVTHLFAAGDGVIAVHNHDLEVGAPVSNLGILVRCQVYRVGLDGTVERVGEVGTERVLGYDGAGTLWIGRASRRPSFSTDPRGRLTGLDVRTGLLHQHPADGKISKPVDRIAAADGLLYVAGRAGSSPRCDSVWRVAGERVDELDLRGLMLRFDPLPAPPDEPEPARTADGLAAEIRAQLTAHGTRFDPRQDRWVDAGPMIHRHFRLREVHVDAATPRVTVTFDWEPEPGTVFGWDFGAAWLASENAYRRGLQSAPDNIWLFALEELDTGLMGRARRERRGDVTWVSTIT